MARIRVSTPVRPTEDPTKVEAALRNLFPELELEEIEGFVKGTSTSLDRLRELIRNQKIRDSARSLFRRGRTDDRTTVQLNKQAAFVSRVNFGEDGPLGEILVEIESDRLDEEIDFVAERTTGPRTSSRSERT